MPGARQGDPADRPRLPNRHATAERGELPGRGASRPERQARQAPDPFASVYRPQFSTDWLPGEPTPPRDVVNWDLWLGPAPWRRYNHKYLENRGWQGYWDFTAGVNLLDWGAHTVNLCQWANGEDETGPVEFEASGKTIVGRYANGVKLVLDCLDTPFGQRPDRSSRWEYCPVRFVGDQVGSDGRQRPDRNTATSLKEELKEVIRRREQGLDVAAHAQFPQLRQVAPQDCCPLAGHAPFHAACFAAAAAWLLNRKLRFDPAKEEFVGDDEANGLRYRPARAPWAV